MGDAGPPSPSIGDIDDTNRSSELRWQEAQREINVLVTGFGPFKSFPKNPSWSIASSLPSTLAPLPSKPASSSPPLPTIRLHAYPSPIRVSYPIVRSEVPPLLDETAPTAIHYDHILHIGMAGGRNFYSLETQAHRDNYKIRDIDGNDGNNSGQKIWRNPKFSSRTDGEGVTGGAAPETLAFGYDEMDVWRKWVEIVNGKSTNTDPEKEPIYADKDANGDFKSPFTSTRNPLSRFRIHHPDRDPSRNSEVDIRVSDDAGRFLCDFIFFTSLAERWKQEQEAKVVFLHVPGDTDEKAIETGRMVAEGLIRAIVGSWDDGARRHHGSVGEKTGGKRSGFTA